MSEKWYFVPFFFIYVFLALTSTHSTYQDLRRHRR